MKSIQPRKQRKMFFNAPLHKKRAGIASHLAENLLLKYDRRSIPVIKGDTVKVMRGSFKGHEDKVAKVHVRKQVIEVEGITTVKADGTKVAKPIHASNVLVTKLNLTDKWRRKKLEGRLSEETKKEIEKEAEEQIKELEGEQLTEELAEEETGEGKETSEEVKEIPEKKKVKKTPSKEPEKKEEKQPKEKKVSKKIKPKTQKTATKKKGESSKKKTAIKAPRKKKTEVRK